jgi:hypothetical protein
MSQRGQWNHFAYHAVLLTPLYNQRYRISSRMIKSTVFEAEIWLGFTLRSSVNDAAVICTAVSMTPLVKIWPLWLRTATVTLDQIFERLWLWLGNIYRKYIGKLSYTTFITFTQKTWGYLRIVFCHRGVIASWFSSQIRSHIQKGFNPCIRVFGGVVDEKKPEVENLVSGSL